MRTLFLLFLGPAFLAQEEAFEVRLGKLRITGIGNPEAAQVLLINAKGEGCNETITLPAASEVAIAANIVKAGGRRIVINDGQRQVRPCWVDDPMAGLVVMAPGRAVAYISGLKNLNEFREELTVEMRPRREVIVEVWPATSEFELAARDDLANFDWILDQSRAGITLKPHFHPPDRRVESLTCDTAKLQKATTEFIPGVVNLYYGGNHLNESCGESSFVLVHNIPVLGDAAHEVGHKLGLNQQDSEFHYFSGHTTGHPRFSCQNIMWESSEILKFKVSVGQAAWMGVSCSSFLADQGGCLECGAFDLNQPAKVVRSRCPRFTEGQPDTEPNCSATCSEEAESALDRMGGERIPVEVGRVRVCTQQVLGERLAERFHLLREHVKSRPDLRLSSDSEGRFVKWWQNRIQTVFLIDATAKEHERNQKDHGGQVSARQRNGLEALDALYAKGPMKGHAYLKYAKAQIELGKFKPGCQVGRQTASKVAPSKVP